MNRHMRVFGAPAFLLIAVTALASCEDEADDAVDTSETGGRAAGEVSGGTISDAMIPLDQLTSTSPPASDPPEDGETASSPAPDGETSDE
ncbi:hypothetical protein [Erythrobacter sp.]|jgi:hypothetical protein|uniref:hypothetical protein n=1 Tax=Erythrobacter sp. TaxID=1042 RepID=UPI002EA262D6|nr:hypothetical protein [Erythrobacter sp.]